MQFVFIRVSFVALKVDQRLSIQSASSAVGFWVCFPLPFASIAVKDYWFCRFS
jgi:hypothetical protein